MTRYFKVGLADAVFEWSVQKRNNTLNPHSMPYVVASASDGKNGIILGKSPKCNKFDIALYEPLSSALLKCANLVVDEADFDYLHAAAAPFFETCAHFGKVRKIFFDSCIIRADSDDFSPSDIESAVSLKTGFACGVAECGEQDFTDFTVETPFSGEVGAAASYLAGRASALLRFGNQCARDFTLRLISPDKTETKTRSLSVPTDSSNVISLTLQSILDFADLGTAETVILEIGGIVYSAESATAAHKKETVRQKYRKPTENDCKKEQKAISKVIDEYALAEFNNLCCFIHDNPLGYDLDTLCTVAERVNNRRLGVGDVYADANYMRAVVGELNGLDSPELAIAFDCCNCFTLLFKIIEKFSSRKKTVTFIGVDSATRLLISLLKRYSAFNNYTFEYPKKCSDSRFDLCVTQNPKADLSSDFTLLICEKRLFSEPEFSDVRSALSSHRIASIVDFEKCGIMGKSHCFAAVIIDKNSQPDITRVVAKAGDSVLEQTQSYITDSSLPYWIIYRNGEFDKMYGELDFDRFDIFCDHQIKPRDLKQSGDLRVVRLNEITRDGGIETPPDVKFLNSAEVADYEVLKFARRDNLYIAPRTSECLRLARKPVGTVTNGSTAVLIPKGGFALSDEALKLYCSSDFKTFYDIAVNRQTVALANDFGALYFIGTVKER